MLQKLNFLSDLTSHKMQDMSAAVRT